MGRVAFTREAAERIAATVRTVEGQRVDLTPRQARDRRQFPTVLVARTTSSSGPGGVYNGIQQAWDGSGFIAALSGRVWSTSIDSLGQLQEVNGNENITSGTLVKVFSVAVPHDPTDISVNAGKVTWFFQSVDALTESEGQGCILLPNEVLNLDATTITGVADGGAISTWNDLSDQVNNFTQSNSSFKPLFRLDEYGTGKHAVDFDGVDDRLDGGTSQWKFLSDGSDWTLYFVMEPASSETTVKGVMGNTASSAETGILVTFNGFQSPGLSCSDCIAATLTNDTIPEVAIQAVSASGSFSRSALSVVGVRFKAGQPGDDMTFYVNSSVQSSGQYREPEVVDTGAPALSMLLGAINSPAPPSVPMDVKMAQVVIYNVAHDVDTELSDTITCLKTKWGIT